MRIAGVTQPKGIDQLLIRSFSNSLERRLRQEFSGVEARRPIESAKDGGRWLRVRVGDFQVDPHRSTEQIQRKTLEGIRFVESRQGHDQFSSRRGDGSFTEAFNS
jgi:hypothetical protein